MQFSECETYCFEAWKAGITGSQLILGEPGIGKSSMAASLAERMTRYVQENHPAAPPAIFEAKDLSSCLPEDIGGLPYRGDNHQGVTTTYYAGQSWLTQFCGEKVYGVLCLDDLPAAAPAVQVAVRQLVLDRRVGEHRLSDGVFIIVTGNRREDKSAASTLPAHFRNSVCSLRIEPFLGGEAGGDPGWIEWYGQQPGHAPVVAAFLRYKPSAFSTLPKDADKHGCFATPRSWTKLGQCWDVAVRTGNQLEVASGWVGEGHATEFLAFVNVRAQLVDPASVLRNPKKAMPNPRQALGNHPDRQIAMATGLGEVAANWRSGSNKELRRTAPLMFMRAVGHVTVNSREHIATAVSTYTSNGGKINDLIGAARANGDDALVQAVVDFLYKTFN